MVALEDFSRIVASIYAAALHPDGWMTPLDEVRRASGAGAASLLGAGAAGAGVERGPVGLVRDVDDGLFVRLTGAAEPTCLLLTAPGRSSQFATSQRIDFVNALVPHWQQALRIHDQVADIAGVLAAMRNAVLVIDPDLSIVHMNSAADRLLSAHDGLRVCAARIEATHRATDSQLQPCIARAIRCQDRGYRSRSTLTCVRPSGAWPYVVHVLPLGPGHAGSALVVVVDPDDKPRPATALIQKIFGMTGSEAEIAVRVLNGDGLKPICEALSLSMATVKTHLQHVFDKTGTHRQAELIRLLLAVIP